MVCRDKIFPQNHKAVVPGSNLIWEEYVQKSMGSRSHGLQQSGEAREKEHAGGRTRDRWQGQKGSLLWLVAGRWGRDREQSGMIRYRFIG